MHGSWWADLVVLSGLFHLLSVSQEELNQHLRIDDSLPRSSEGEIHGGISIRVGHVFPDHHLSHLALVDDFLNREGGNNDKISVDNMKN